jgi:outer membrane lipoprotein-sorting protein
MTLLILLGFSVNTFAQKDKKAEEILDKLEEKNESYETIIADFTITYNSLQSEDKSTHSGKIIMKGDQYKLEVRNSIVYYDGKTMWNYLKEVNEVNISEPVNNPDEQDILNHPNQIFDIYKKDFKYKFIGTSDGKEGKIFEIDLYPSDLEKDYSRIKLKVYQEDYRIHSVKIFAKDGTRYVLRIDKMKTNDPVPDSTFVFDKAKHPDVEVIDMRF